MYNVKCLKSLWKKQKYNSGDRPLIVEERREYVSIVVWPLKYNLFIALVKETLYKCIIEIKVGIHN